MTSGRRLTDEEVEVLRTEARGVPAQTSLRPFCEEHARILGCHPSTIYRAIQSVRPAAARRQRRKDAGARKVLSEEDAWRDLAAMVAQFDYDAELAIDTLNANLVREGKAPIDVHPETFRRHLRQRGVSRRHNSQDLRVHRRWEAAQPNDLWQIDSTVAAAYYIDTDDTIGYEAPVVRNKTKAGNGLPRVWLIVAKDDCSRVTWGRFCTANSALMWRDLLLRAMKKGGFGDPTEWPAYGVPKAIYSDQDSAMKSGIMTRTLELLGIERKLARPSTEHETNAQAKGKSERAIGILQGFEKTTRGQRYDGLEAMNEDFRKHLIWVNRRIHGETNVAPFERFMGVQELLLLPSSDMLKRVLYREVERTVRSDVAIHLEGKVYQLPRRSPFIDFVGHKVPVLYFEADLSKITVVLNGEDHMVDAVEAVPDVAGDFHQAPTPKAVELKRELQQRDLSHIDTHAVHSYRADRTHRVYLAARPEIEHPLTEAALAPVMIRRGRAVDRMQKDGVVGRPPSELDRAAMAAFFRDRLEVPEDELKTWIESRRGGTTHHQTARAEGA